MDGIGGHGEVRIRYDVCTPVTQSPPDNYVTIEPVIIDRELSSGILKLTPSYVNVSTVDMMSDLNSSLHVFGFNSSVDLVISKYDSSRLSEFVLISNLGTQVSPLATLYLNTETTLSNIIGIREDDVVINDMTVRVISKVCCLSTTL